MYVVFDCFGELYREPSGLTMRNLLESMSSSDDDFHSVVLVHETGWSLAYNRHQTMTRENVKTGEGPYHQKDISVERALLLWDLLASGNLDKLYEEIMHWESGYGIFEVAGITEEFPGRLQFGDEITDRFRVYIGERSAHFGGKQGSYSGPLFDFLFINCEVINTMLYNSRTDFLRIYSEGNALGTVSDCSGYAAVDVGPHSRPINSFEFCLRLLEKQVEIEFRGKAAGQYQWWSIADYLRRTEKPMQQEKDEIDFHISFSVSDLHLNKVLRSIKDGAADRLLKYKRTIVFREHWRDMEWRRC